MDKARILIVDDERSTLDAMCRFLKRRFEVTGANDGAEAVIAVCLDVVVNCICLVTICDDVSIRECKIGVVDDKAGIGKL